MENAGVFYDHLEYFTVIWYILWPFGNVMVIWYIFPRFGKLCPEKSGNPGTIRPYGNHYKRPLRCHEWPLQAITVFVHQ
jgi:hypothetical protein